MTDTVLDYDPNDTGEIPGEETVRILGETRMRIDTGEKTQRIEPDTIKMIVEAPSFTAIPRRVIELDDTVKFSTSRVIGLADLEGPQKPPPPLPKPKYDDPAETGVNILRGRLDGELPEPDEDGDDVVFRRGCGARTVPVAAIVDREPATVRERRRRGRHAQPAPRWATFLLDAGVTTVFWSALALAALAVVR